VLRNLKRSRVSRKGRRRRRRSRCVLRRPRRMSPGRPRRRRLHHRNARMPRRPRHNPARRSRQGHHRHRPCGPHRRSQVRRGRRKRPSHRRRPPPLRRLPKRTSPGRPRRNALRRRTARAARVETRRSRSRNSSDGGLNTRSSHGRRPAGHYLGGCGGRFGLSRTAEARFLLLSRHRKGFRRGGDAGAARLTTLAVILAREPCRAGALEGAAGSDGR